VRFNWCGSAEVSSGSVVADLQITVIAFADTNRSCERKTAQLKARRMKRGGGDLAGERADHDPLRLKRIMVYLLWRMIFSENRSPVFGIMLKLTSASI
jgi:hypothetical protein